MSERRVVSLVPSSTETLVALGADVVACTKFCEQPQPAPRRRHQESRRGGDRRDGSRPRGHGPRGEPARGCERAHRCWARIVRLRRSHPRRRRPGRGRSCRRTSVVPCLHSTSVSRCRPRRHGCSSRSGGDHGCRSTRRPTARRCSLISGSGSSPPTHHRPIRRSTWPTSTIDGRLRCSCRASRTRSTIGTSPNWPASWSVGGDRPVPIIRVDGQDLFWWGSRTPAAVERLRAILGDL